MKITTLLFSIILLVSCTTVEKSYDEKMAEDKKHAAIQKELCHTWHGKIIFMRSFTLIEKHSLDCPYEEYTDFLGESIGAVYIMRVQFDNGMDSYFNIRDSDFGPDKGSPENVFEEFSVGNEINVRMSNGYLYRFNGETPVISRYENTSHLNKGYIDCNYPPPERMHVKCAGAFVRSPEHFKEVRWEEESGEYIGNLY
jgi:hypothetical protein